MNAVLIVHSEAAILGIALEMDLCSVYRYLATIIQIRDDKTFHAVITPHCEEILSTTKRAII